MKPLKSVRRSEPDACSAAEAARAALHDAARRQARIDRVFGSLYPGQGYSGDGGFTADHYHEQRPPHHQW